jgi:pimeloyl-ACP methyl ester carboxylesterase
VDGPGRHRYVAANGARFHVVELGHGPLVVFLHGFPEFWWAWRHQLPLVAAAGYTAVAMDLRGYGHSDKTPRGYDPLTLAADVSGVIRCLGSRTAVVVGHGWGGYVGWATAASHPSEVTAMCAVGAPHPADLLRPPFGSFTRAAIAHLVAMQPPWWPERRIGRGHYIDSHLASWSAPGSGFPSPDEVRRYREALSRWPSPHCALEYHRWLVRSRLRRDGRAFSRALRSAIDIPVLQVNGAVDPAVRRSTVEAAARRVTGPLDNVVLPRTGHFPHEEAPTLFNDALLTWLSDRTRPGADEVAGS